MSPLGQHTRMQVSKVEGSGAGIGKHSKVISDWEERIESDNFHSAKEVTKQEIEKVKTYKNMLEKETWDDRTKYLINILMTRALNSANKVMNEYGPHLVWVDQYPPSHFEDSWKKLEADRSTERELNVEIGRLRRQSRQANKST